MTAAWWMLGALAVLAIAYRYYSAFIAAKVLCLDDARVTPAHRSNDGHNFHPTNKWVLFGHHFAAITGAGPLIGPVLAAQFGFLPGLLLDPVRRRARRRRARLRDPGRRARAAAAARSPRSRATSSGPCSAWSRPSRSCSSSSSRSRGSATWSSARWPRARGACSRSALSIPIALVMGLYIYGMRGGSCAGIREATHRRRGPAAAGADRRQVRRPTRASPTTSGSRARR